MSLLNGLRKICSTNNATGRQTSTTLTQSELQAVNDFLISRGKSVLASAIVMSHSKAIINHQTITSCAMSKATRTNSYTIAYQLEDRVAYGLVQKLISLAGCHLALVKKLKVLQAEQSLPDAELNSTIVSKLLEDFVSVKELNTYVAVDIHQILTKCFNTSAGGQCTQLTHSVNSIEVVLR